MKFKDELDQLVQDSFCKLKIMSVKAHQLLANFQAILSKD